MRLLIGIDDTDNLESRGTGYRARCLGARLSQQGLGQLRGVTRHQLLVDDAIPFTSHNSALCIDLHDAGSLEQIVACCREFLLAESAPGSDAGLCIADWDVMEPTSEDYGRRAQREVLNQSIARDQARDWGLLLEGLTGDHGGIIGALAAVTLRRGGNDGRFVWLEKIRELDGALTAARLLDLTGIDIIRTLDGERPAASESVCIDPWPRPVLIDGQAVLLVERTTESGTDHDWQLVAREIIRRY
ncbi:MAG: hypothetical protein RQ729_09715 [Wenzhouxiangellaceae bacterium]|nr:hypothetical protein [Wenzhouxiangellaceae bacterium]